MSSFWRVIHGLLLLGLYPGVRSEDHDAVQSNKNGSPDDPALTHYVSRPDLRVPKWRLTMHKPELNSPGYWFTAPYRGMDGEQCDETWVGPHIYDGTNGELVWTGGPIFKHNVEDFRISDVNGEQMMTLFAYDKAHILNNDYTIGMALDIEDRGTLNTHELNFVDNGTRVIFLRNGQEKVSRKESKTIGYRGECTVNFDGFSELDVTTAGWPEVFEWKSHGKIELKESTFVDGSAADRCGGWDYLHANSVDKTPEGDYLLSGRHTDTIYKISGEDGTILWRLGGSNSDFDLKDGLVFSRQHDVRYRGQNSTHFWLSIMDNSKGQDSQAATHDFSRGLLLAIDEGNMSATLEAHYDHPYHAQNAVAYRRGNLQQLPNGNVLMGWSERAMQSEFTANGELIWEAILQVDFMGSYRNYKFADFVGRPIEHPFAVARVDEDDEGAVTTTHVSWNGATEVVVWNLYKTSRDGRTARRLIATAPKIGFETELHYYGFAKYVVLEAIDREGRSIRETSVIETNGRDELSGEVLAEEEAWLRNSEARNHGEGLFGWPSRTVAAFSVGAAVGVVLALMLWFVRQPGTGGIRRCFRRRREQKYDPISQRLSDGDIMPLHRLRRDSVAEPEP